MDVSLSHYRAAVLRSALLLLVVTTLGGGIGYLFASSQPDVFEARSEFLVPLGEERPTGFLREDRRLTTQIEAARSRAVLQPAADELGITVEALRKKIRVDTVGASELVRISARDEDRLRATAIVEAVHRNYLELLTRISGLPTGTDATADPVTTAIGGAFLQPVIVLTDPYVLPNSVAPRPIRTAAVGAAAAGTVAVLAVFSALLWRALPSISPQAGRPDNT